MGAISADSPGGFVVEMDGGVTACVSPARPERSIVNSVMYEDAAALAAALPALRVVYEDAGIAAWTVWVRPGDEAAAAALAEAGHALDATPRLMAVPLAEMDLGERTVLDLDPDPSLADVAHLNDAAYGIPPQGSFDTVLRDPVGPGWHVHLARVDGEPAACLLTRIHDADCWVGLVATAPAARGRGLATELLRGALRQARETGAQTTSLEATKLGFGVYARLGYQDLGELQMWERRASAS
jgi:GNAT superfamily N-acetyltransferase